jgi:hypothetical protein
MPLFVAIAPIHHDHLFYSPSLAFIYKKHPALCSIIYQELICHRKAPRKVNEGIEPNEGTPAFNKLGSVPVSRRSPEDCSKDVDDTLTWLPKGKAGFEDPTEDFKKIDHLLPNKRNQVPQDRACEIEGVLDWLCNTGFKTSF